MKWLGLTVVALVVVVMLFAGTPAQAQDVVGLTPTPTEGFVTIPRQYDVYIPVVIQAMPDEAHPYCVEETDPDTWHNAVCFSREGDFYRACTAIYNMNYPLTCYQWAVD